MLSGFPRTAPGTHGKGTAVALAEVRTRRSASAGRNPLGSSTAREVGLQKLLSTRICDLMVERRVEDAKRIQRLITKLDHIIAEGHPTYGHAVAGREFRPETLSAIILRKLVLRE